ncbi:glutamine synthetase [Ideonella sp. 4Y16]|uniref:glutamine synthetase family protein n=1 Tax=Ideonella alba TaxID=2824118 RepID=UPI001B37E261|nr:glutamine synthetase family protein [Ideonella alba]MBQ0942058.1 glutamine synthetase [Ideonella alba]
MSPILPLPLPDADTLRDALDVYPDTRRVECATGDFSSVARGKHVARADFEGQVGCKLPSVVLGLTLTGGEPADVIGPVLPASYADVHLVPDLSTLAPRPGRPGELCVVCEPSGALRPDLDASALSPRAALRAALVRLKAAGLRATVAPELEFFLLERGAAGELLAARAHPDAPARERACEAYSLERAGHFDGFFDALYEACATQRIPVSGHAHESALSQYEVNFLPGEPLAQADAVWRFKRLARELAARRGFLASFAAKPFLDQPGTGMHWHLSLQHTDGRAWPHAFSPPGGEPVLPHFIAGLQAGAAAAMAFCAPFDMSYDRIRLSDAAPSHASWGEDSRSLAFRIPASSPAARRVENRLPGGDANPYLILASMIGLGLDGLQAARLPGEGQALPTSLSAALDALQSSSPLRAQLGAPLVDAYVGIKRHESAERQRHADPRQQWDLWHLVELA